MTSWPQSLIIYQISNLLFSYIVFAHAHDNLFKSMKDYMVSMLLDIPLCLFDPDGSMHAFPSLGWRVSDPYAIFQLIGAKLGCSIILCTQ